MNQIGQAILLAIVENSIFQEKSFIVGEPCFLGKRLDYMAG